MLTNDIVGASKADDGTVDGETVRLFAEGVPTSETPQQATTRPAVGGENDSPSRQLGRFVTDVTGTNVRPGRGRAAARGPAGVLRLRVRHPRSRR